jgi:hypothetical protein
MTKNRWRNLRVFNFGRFNLAAQFVSYLIASSGSLIVSEVRPSSAICPGCIASKTRRMSTEGVSDT